MATNTRIQAKARSLIALSLDRDGTVSAQRAMAVVKTLCESRPRELRALLKAYVAGLERCLAQSEARIEYAGALDKAALDALLASLRKRYGRALRPVVVENRQLIAGVRARVGDDVYDNNLASRLAALQEALQ